MTSHSQIFIVAQAASHLSHLNTLLIHEDKGGISLSFMDHKSETDHIILGPHLNLLPPPLLLAECFLATIKKLCLYINQPYILLLGRCLTIDLIHILPLIVDFLVGTKG